MQKTLVLRPVRASRTLLKSVATVALTGLMSVAAFAQDPPPAIITAAEDKIEAMATYAGTLGTAALGVVAVIAIVALAVKFLRR